MDEMKKSTFDRAQQDYDNAEDPRFELPDEEPEDEENTQEPDYEVWDD